MSEKSWEVISQLTSSEGRIKAKTFTALEHSLMLALSMTYQQDKGRSLHIQNIDFRTFLIHVAATQFLHF